MTDGQGLSSSRSAYITVEPAKDDPPTADSGSSLYTVRLPQSEVTLYANKSKDDHGIDKYEWVHVNPEEDNPINIEVHAQQWEGMHCAWDSSSEHSSLLKGGGRA